MKGECFQDKTLCNTQKAQSRAYTKPPSQINCPQPQSPLQSVGLVYEEERMILRLNEQAESQQSLIQPLVRHRLPGVTLEVFFHVGFNEVPKDLTAPAQCKYRCPAAAQSVLWGGPGQGAGGRTERGAGGESLSMASGSTRLEVPLPQRGCPRGTLSYRRHKLGTSG